MPIVELEDVAFSYGRGQPAVLEHVDLAVERGEFVGIAGPNGGGKTTLIRLIVGLERPTRGDIRIFGETPERLSRRYRLGYLPQRAQSGLDAPITVEELVTAGRVPVRGVLRSPNREDRLQVEAAIGRVGLDAERARPLRTLSGGQQQRAFIARALAGEPELLVLDEPTTGVDADAQDVLAALLNSLRQELAVTILYVSHEFGAIEPHVGRLVLVRGGIEFDGPPVELESRWHDPGHVHL